MYFVTDHHWFYSRQKTNMSYGFGQHLKSVILVESEQHISNRQRHRSDENVCRRTTKIAQMEHKRIPLMVLSWYSGTVMCTPYTSMFHQTDLRYHTVYDSVLHMLCLYLSCCSAEINLSPSLQQTKMTW